MPDLKNILNKRLDREARRKRIEVEAKEAKKHKLNEKKKLRCEVSNMYTKIFFV